MKRRDVLAGSGGLAGVLLSGLAPAAQAREYAVSRQTDTPDAAVELLPAPSELDTEFVQIIHTDLSDVDETDQLTFGAAVVRQIDDLDISDVDAVATALTEDQITLSCVTGSFDRVTLDETVSEHGDWRVSHSGSTELTVSSADGRLVAAVDGESDARVDAVETATEVARESGETALDSLELFERSFDRFGDKKVFYFVPEPGDSVPTAGEEIQTLAAGFEKSPLNIRGSEGTFENEFALEEAPDATLDRETVKELLQELEAGPLLEFEMERSGTVVFAETVIRAPPERSRENSPDATITMNANPDDGTAVIEHEEGESIPATDLELWVNGEFVDQQPYREFSTFEPGDSMTVDTGPLANVFLRWVDDEANEYFEYVDDVVGKESFDVSHDYGTGTVEITYTGSDADTALLDLQRRSRITEDGETSYKYEELTAPIESLGSRLRSGDTIAVEGVQMRDSVTLELDVPPKPPGTFGPNTTLVRYYARPPRFRIRRQANEQPHALYFDDMSRDAENFRILADGSPIDVQPSDEFDTLEEGDQLPLGDFEYGTKLVIEWVGGEETFVVSEHVVEPLVRLETTYDDSAGTVTLRHTNGEAVDATNIEVLFDGESAPTQPADEFDKFAPGDTLTAAAEPFDRVVVQWSDGETELTIHETVVGRNLFEARYRASEQTLELTYTGEQSADPSEIAVERFGVGTVGGEIESPFEDTETLSTGDSVVIENVTPQTVVRLARTSEDGDTTEVLAHFRATPQYEFDFETQDGSLVVEYTGRVVHDADEFTVFADGTEADVQFSDEHDTLEQGDTVALGSFDPGTPITIEWPASTEETQTVAEYTVVPSAEFEVAYDENEGVLRVEHAGGDEIAAEALGIYAPPVTDNLVSWDGEGTVSEGDSTTIEADTKPDVVLVIYRRREQLAEIPL